MAATNTQTLTTKLSSIGDAIRDKTGKTELLTLDDMPTEIAAIETGGGSSGGGDFTPLQEFYVSLFKDNDIYFDATNLSDSSLRADNLFDLTTGILNIGTRQGQVKKFVLDKALDFSNYTSVFKGWGVNQKEDIEINLSITGAGRSMFDGWGWGWAKPERFTGATPGSSPESYYSVKEGAPKIVFNLPNATRLGQYPWQTTYVSEINCPNVRTGSTSTFYQIAGLKKLYLPKLATSNSLQFISTCSQLEDVYITDLQREVGHSGHYSWAWFYKCFSIKHFIIDSHEEGSYSIPTLNTYFGTYQVKNSFDNEDDRFRNGEAFIYVPKAYLSEYETATNWSALYAKGAIKAIEDNQEELQGIFPEMDAKYGWTE